MTHLEFIALNDECLTAVENYFAEAEKTSEMLGKCTSSPLPFKERFALLSQEIVEKEAGLRYLEIKRLLHRAALLGYCALATETSTVQVPVI